MSTSGTTSFAPPLSDLTLEAFSRIGMRPTSLTADHLFQARMSANLMQSAWSNRQVNLWKVALKGPVALVQGQATYTLTSDVITILDSYIRTSVLSGQPTDFVMFPISRTEYSAQPDKTSQARPTTFWFDRLTIPTVTFWQTPDENGPYQFFYYAATQIQDAVMPGGVGPEVPYRFYDAFAADLAARLARKFAPALAAELKLEAKMSFDEAAREDTEDVPLYIFPGLTHYFR